MSGLLAAMTTFVAGVVLGAAIHRWGQWDRATEHHTRYPSDEMGEALLRQFNAMDDSPVGRMVQRKINEWNA